MRELRVADPSKYSQKVLAEMFNVPRGLVATLAPLPEQLREQVDQQNYLRQIQEESVKGKSTFLDQTRIMKRKRLRDSLLKPGPIPLE